MYYPKSKVITGLYTSGNELILSTTQERYVGYYYKGYDNRYFTGKEPSNDAIELLIPVTPTRNKTFSPLHRILPPTQDDYNLGYMQRFFAKRVNGGVETIVEISKDDVNKLFGNILYMTIDLNWMIDGPLYDDSFGDIPIYGVVDSNKRMLDMKEKQMPGISTFLSNLTQYYRNIA